MFEGELQLFPEDVVFVVGKGVVEVFDGMVESETVALVCVPREEDFADLEGLGLIEDVEPETGDAGGVGVAFNDGQGRGGRGSCSDVGFIKGFAAVAEDVFFFIFARGEFCGVGKKDVAGRKVADGACLAYGVVAVDDAVAVESDGVVGKVFDARGIDVEFLRACVGVAVKAVFTGVF